MKHTIYDNENARQMLLCMGLQQTIAALEVFDFIHILFTVLPTVLSKFGQSCYKSLEDYGIQFNLSQNS